MNKVVIAKIISAHGIKGLVKLLSFTENQADFVKYCRKLFDKKNKPYQIKILNQFSSAKNNIFIGQIEGINDRNQAELLRNVELFINRNDLKNLSDDQFYYIDLIGLRVVNLEKITIGKLISVNNFGAGGLVEIEFNPEFKNNIGMNNFSFSDQIFPEVNLKEGFVVFNCPEIVETKSSKGNCEND